MSTGTSANNAINGHLDDFCNTADSANQHFQLIFNTAITVDSIYIYKKIGKVYLSC